MSLYVGTAGHRFILMFLVPSLNVKFNRFTRKLIENLTVYKNLVKSILHLNPLLGYYAYRHKDVLVRHLI